MITQLQTAAQRADFLAAIRGRPYFHALLGRDIALWADNPGAPSKLFALPGAALAVSGPAAQLCGKPEDWEEVAAFLRFVGVERLTTDQPSTGAANLPLRRALYLYTLAAGERLPMPPAPAGCTLDREPSMGLVADFVFGQEPARRDAFYSEACTAVAHGMAQARAVRDAAGRAVCTVGAYAIYGGEAYMAMGETLEELRGQGIGGWAIAGLANELADAGHTVTFLCEAKRRRFYTRLGFTECLKYYQYYVVESPWQKERQ